MTMSSQNTQPQSVDVMVQARDAQHETLARVLRSVFKAPEAVIAKCYIKPLGSDASASEKTGQTAANPLMVRGLHIS